VIPKAILELCTKDMLVMEFLEGEKMIDVLARQADNIAKSKGMPVEQFMEENKGKPPLSPLKVKYYNLLLDASWVLRSMWRVARNTLTGFGLLARRLEIEARPDRLLDIPTLVDLVVKVHGHQLFIDGALNGDAHPGNILILSDGRIGLIDFGQVKVLPDTIRRKLARLFKSLLRDSPEGVRDVCRETGLLKTKLMDKDPSLIHRRCELYFNQDNMELTENRYLQTYLEILEKRDPTIHLEDDCVMPIRLTMMMRGMGKILNYPIKTAERWEGFVDRVLREAECS